MQEPAISAGHQQTSDSLLADSYSFKAVVGLVSLMVAVFAIVVIAMSYGQMFRRRLIKIDVQGQESEVRTLSSYRSLQNRAYQSAVGLTMCLCSLLGTLAISIFTIRDVLKLHKEAENEYILYCQGIKVRSVIHSHSSLLIRFRVRIATPIAQVPWHRLKILPWCYKTMLAII